MTKHEIKQELTQRYTSFADYIGSLNERDFMHSATSKWTAGQQLEHLRRSISLLPFGIRLPNFMVKLVFGKMRRAPMSYEQLVKRYSTVLESGGKASGIFIPPPVAFNQRESITRKLLSTIGSINRDLDRLKEEQLDARILPHPLLGSLTVREMMYFTLYHVDHHKRNITQQLTARAANR